MKDKRIKKKKPGRQMGETEREREGERESDRQTDGKRFESGMKEKKERKEIELF